MQDFAARGLVTLLLKEIFVFCYGSHRLAVLTHCRKNTVLNVEGGGVYGDYYILKV
jgi:hypothetical protein